MIWPGLPMDGRSAAKLRPLEIIGGCGTRLRIRGLASHNVSGQLQCFTKAMMAVRQFKELPCQERSLPWKVVSA